MSDEELKQIADKADMIVIWSENSDSGYYNKTN